MPTIRSISYEKFALSVNRTQACQYNGVLKATVVIRKYYDKTTEKLHLSPTREFITETVQ